MSFSGDIKREILSVRFSKQRLRQAQAYGLFAFARAFSPDEICLYTESAEIAARYRDYLRQFAPRNAEISREAETRRGRTLYRVGLPREGDRRGLMARMTEQTGELLRRFDTQEELSAFLSGAFLACGNASDPGKSYHLEFAVREQAMADLLQGALDAVVSGARQTRRRELFLIYYKECVPIEDVLTLMGASKSSLAMVEIEMVKEMRNRVMRVTNCETANIDKTVKASSAQVEDIELILRDRGLQSLPQQLREAALARMENPELSLRELAETFDPPLSRSGVHHRLDKLSKLAEEIRREMAGKGGGAHE